MRSLGRTLRSETGAISAGTAILFALLAVGAYIALAATQADKAHFGTVPVPAVSTVDLTKGEIDVYYAEKTDGGQFVLPADLNVAIRDSAGTVLELSMRGASSEETDEGLTQLIGGLTIPEDGVYSVEATGSPAAGALNPEITFGQDPLQAAISRAKKVGEMLIGPIGVLVLAALAFLYFSPRIKAKNKKPTHYSEF